MNTRQKIARAESQENLVKRLLKKYGLAARQGGQGAKENRTECDIHLVDHPVAIEVQFADIEKQKNENYSIGKDKLAKINPEGREAFLLFGNENSGRYTIVSHAVLREEADEVSCGNAEYVGLQDKGRWYLIYPEYLTDVCVCEAETLEELIKRFSELERFRSAKEILCSHTRVDPGDEFNPDRCQRCFQPVFPAKVF